MASLLQKEQFLLYEDSGTICWKDDSDLCECLKRQNGSSEIKNEDTSFAFISVQQRSEEELRTT
jgi:hypothetical protein